MADIFRIFMVPLEGPCWVEESSTAATGLGSTPSLLFPSETPRNSESTGRAACV
ncbi:hypothetical protein OAE26_00770 [Synechococcus sp. AH-551-E05]|nr:hypothetical protein [Synechococcus sp. AH-551-E05]MDB4651099.1 hypothetical protein [Synechococcus sp. AH-551-E05]